MGFYHDVFIQNADKRVENDFLMKDPLPIIITVVMYLWMVTDILPNYMKERKEYSLKIIIQIYNVMQCLACCYQVYGLGVNGWFSKFSYVCEPVDYSNDPAALNILQFTYLNIVIKMTELLETVFFRLRKKDNQVSYLHVYHHASTVCFAWLTHKYIAGGMGTFAIFANSIIHIIMYSYYFLAALGPSVQKRLNWIKNKITILQLIQFVIILLNTAFMLNPYCNFNKYIPTIFFVNICILMAFFINFYKKAYSKKENIKKQS